MDNLRELEANSIYIIREAYNQFKEVGMLWSIGKDSTVLLWLVRKAFYGEIPFPIIHLDTGFKFKEIYDFRDKYKELWNLDLQVYKNQEAMDRGVCPEKDRFECCNELKTNALKEFLAKSKLRALILGIRRDEHGIRAKERVFSARDKEFEWNYKEQAPELWDQYNGRLDSEGHCRIHPLLEWTELDIWKYIKSENIPVNELYFQKHDKRFRSIGCEPCCQPIESSASTIDEIISELENTNISERSGRTQDKESAYMMQKLRSLGYM